MVKTPYLSNYPYLFGQQFTAQAPLSTYPGQHAKKLLKVVGQIIVPVRSHDGSLWELHVSTQTPETGSLPASVEVGYSIPSDWMDNWKLASPYELSKPVPTVETMQIRVEKVQCVMKCVQPMEY